MLQIEDHGSVRELRLDHPPANALRREALAAVDDAVRAAPREGARALVLSGRPGFFSAGLDVPYLLEQPEAEVQATFEALFGAMRTLARSPVPVAAAMTGHATAGGAVLGLYCDYRVMAEGSFRIGMNEVQVGLPIPREMFEALSHLTGPRIAERLLVEARLVDPAQAHRIGLVDALAAPEEVVPAALAWCERVAAQPPAAVRLTRGAARARIREGFDDDGVLVPAEFANAWSTEETQAAMRALVDRLAKR